MTAEPIFFGMLCRHTASVPITAGIHTFLFLFSMFCRHTAHVPITTGAVTDGVQ